MCRCWVTLGLEMEPRGLPGMGAAGGGYIRPQPGSQDSALTGLFTAPSGNSLPGSRAGVEVGAGRGESGSVVSSYLGEEARSAACSTLEWSCHLVQAICSSFCEGWAALMEGKGLEWRQRVRNGDQKMGLSAEAERDRGQVDEARPAPWAASIQPVTLNLCLPREGAPRKASGSVVPDVSAVRGMSHMR